MIITLTWQRVVTFVAGLTALGTLIAIFVKAVRWVDKQEAQDKELAAVKAHHEEDIHAIKDELTLIMYGLLAALQGLQEQGCDGPVTDAVDKINKHLNKKAHE